MKTLVEIVSEDPVVELNLLIVYLDGDPKSPLVLALRFIKSQSSNDFAGLAWQIKLPNAIAEMQRARNFMLKAFRKT